MFNNFPKRKYIVLLLLLLLILLTLKFLSNQKLKPSDYFPSKKIVKSFKGKLDHDEFVQIIDRIEDGKIQIKQVDAETKIAMVYDISKEMIRLVYVLEEGEFRDDYISGLRENRNHIIMKAPISIGTTWEDYIGGVYSIVEVDSIVKTPAGNFETLLIEYNNGHFNVKEYYARDIGIVKIIIDNYLVTELVDLKIDY